MTCKVCGDLKIIFSLVFKKLKKLNDFFPSKLAGSVTLKKGENREILPDFFFPFFFPFFSIFSDIFFSVKICRTVIFQELKNLENNRKKNQCNFWQH